MTGITLTCGDTWRISSMTISLRPLDEEVYFSSMHLRMASGWDKVKQGVHSSVPEPGITLDTRLFSQNVVVLTLKLANDFLEPESEIRTRSGRMESNTNSNSLSILSQNPGCLQW